MDGWLEETYLNFKLHDETILPSIAGLAGRDLPKPALDTGLSDVAPRHICTYILPSEQPRIIPVIHSRPAGEDDSKIFGHWAWRAVFVPKLHSV